MPGLQGQSALTGQLGKMGRLAMMGYKEAAVRLAWLATRGMLARQGKKVKQAIPALMATPGRLGLLATKGALGPMARKALQVPKGRLDPLDPLAHLAPLTALSFLNITSTR